MTAREMREAGLLWPQNLDTQALIAEFQACDQHVSPVSYEMLLDEYRARVKKGLVAL